MHTPRCRSSSFTITSVSKAPTARTNLSFHYLGDFWNDRISSLIVVSGVWRFYRDEYYKGDHWDLGPGFYECFFTEKGPDDVISSFQAIESDLNQSGQISASCLSAAILTTASAQPHERVKPAPPWP